jgi:hypothetical protein
MSVTASIGLDLEPTVDQVYPHHTRLLISPLVERNVEDVPVARLLI